MIREFQISDTQLVMQLWLAGNEDAHSFVAKEYRSQGIGRQLLEYVKQLHSTLSLNVYQKNERALRFYRENGFTIVSKQNDEHTGEIEFTMIWNKNKVE